MGIELIIVAAAIIIVAIVVIGFTDASALIKAFFGLLGAASIIGVFSFPETSKNIQSWFGTFGVSGLVALGLLLMVLNKYSNLLFNKDQGKLTFFSKTLISLGLLVLVYAGYNGIAVKDHSDFFRAAGEAVVKGVQAIEPTVEAGVKYASEKINGGGYSSKSGFLKKENQCQDPEGNGWALVDSGSIVTNHYKGTMLYASEYDGYTLICVSGESEFSEGTFTPDGRNALSKKYSETKPKNTKAMSDTFNNGNPDDDNFWQIVSCRPYSVAVQFRKGEVGTLYRCVGTERVLLVPSSGEFNLKAVDKMPEMLENPSPSGYQFKTYIRASEEAAQ